MKNLKRCVTLGLMAIFTMWLISFLIWYNYTINSFSYFTKSKRHAQKLSAESAITEATLNRQRMIFFLETSGCQEGFYEAASLSPRQACAVESAARTNPDAKVFLMFAVPTRNQTDDSYLWQNKSRLLHQLNAYDNVYIGMIRFDEYVKDTPLERWYKTGKLQRSKFIVAHSSDVLRYLTMWKHGGFYMDLDVVVMKNLEPLGVDFVVAESKGYAVNGVLSFNRTGFGHEVIYMFLREIELSFKENTWGTIGPILVTRVMKRICKNVAIPLMTADKCNGFRVLDPSTFYPLHWKLYNNYFNSSALEESKKMIESSYTIHVWNKLTSKIKIKIGDKDNLYISVANEFCPSVMKQVEQYF